jgi:hypothetical protein
MRYYSEIKRTDDGGFKVLVDCGVHQKSKLARYRINFPNESAHVERIGPYMVEEKIGGRWQKIGIVSSQKTE